MRYSIVRSKKRWFLVFGILTFIALIGSTQLYVKTGAEGMLSWLKIFFVQIIIWNIWGGLTPAIFYFGRRFSPGKKYINALIHFLVSVLIVLFYLLIYVLVYLGFNGLPVSVEVINQVYTGILINLFHWYFILYWITVGIGHFYETLKSHEKTELDKAHLKVQLAKAQLKSLKVQLHPHFLFNTLNTISSLVRKNRNPEAIQMLAGIGDLLRVALQDISKQEVSLRDELSFLNTYLQIEKVRFKELDLEILYDEKLDDIEVPNLLLQPIVENAIHHGISKKRTAKKLIIDISKREGHLCICIENEGPGLPAQWSLKDHIGIGLTNSTERLKQLYGDRSSFDMKNSAIGVKVIITIPIKTNSDE